MKRKGKQRTHNTESLWRRKKKTGKEVKKRRKKTQTMKGNKQMIKLR
jgi:hypothetical protein